MTNQHPFKWLVGLQCRECSIWEIFKRWVENGLNDRPFAQQELV
ncbi:MAG: hypothetical protein PVS3B3_33140 [Ktedonobacteraceae bacterium]